jgi:hypothetical protein
MSRLERLAEVSERIESTSRAGEFIAVARFLLAAKGDGLPGALARAEAARATPRVISILKDAVSAGSMADENWAGSLVDYQIATGGFLDSLRYLSVFDRLLADGMRRVPLKSKVVVVTAGAAGRGTREGHVKPISTLSLADGAIEPTKATAIIVVNDELTKTSGAAASLFAIELRSAVASATDEVFLESLLDGVVPTASAGSTTANVITDIATLLGAVTTGPDSRVYIVIDPANAKRLVTKLTTGGDFAFPLMGLNGGEIVRGVTALVSDRLPTGNALMIVADGLAGDSGPITLDESRAATIQLDTAPNSPPSASAVPMSLFQQNRQALRAERYFGFEVVRANSVAALHSVAY